MKLLIKGLSGGPEWSPKKALDLIEFLKMQYPENPAMQIMGAAQAICMIALANDVTRDSFVMKMAKIIVTWPGWELGKEKTLQMYSDEAKEETKNVN